MSFGFEMNQSFAGFAPQTPPDGCTQCSICLTACPTFVKSEDIEQSPMGRIRLMRALENGESEGLALDKLESCLGCYSCESVCPSKVDYGNLLDESLARLRQKRPSPAITRMMLFLAERRTLLKTLVRSAWLKQLIGARSLMRGLGLYKLLGMQRANALMGRVNYPGRLRNRTKQTQQDKRVALFTGCFSPVMEQEVQQATIDVFNALGIEVTLPKSQGCCGALHRHSGELDKAARLARNNIEAFATEQADAIVTTSSGCGAGLKAYNQWLDGEELSIPVMDVNHYLANLLKQRKVLFKQMPVRVALHTPCSLRQTEGQEAAVVELLRKIPGLEIVPLSGEPRCCGAGGSQMLSQPEMADALRDDMVAEIKEMGADLVISSNLGCAMHLGEGLAQAGLDIPLKHPVQLLAKALSVELVSITN